MNHISSKIYITIFIGFFSMEESYSSQLTHKDTHSIQAVVLAAGKSTRFAMGSSKLAFPLCGQPMVLYPLSVLEALAIPTIVVTGYQQELIQQIITQRTKITPLFVEQTIQKGTGHAVACSKAFWQADHILIINGDMPLIDQALISRVLNEHLATKATVSFVVATCDDQLNGYGKVIRANNTIKIIEARDFKGTAQEGQFINAGIYLISKDFLHAEIEKLSLHENSQEWYITDIIAAASNMGLHIHTVETDFDTIRGINTVNELATAEKIIRHRIIQKYMQKGVYFEQPETTIIEQSVTIGAGTRIGAGVHIAQNTRIGTRCIIGCYSTITNSILNDQVTILPHCVITDSEIHDHVSVGPFAHVRNVHSLHEHACIGNFVEVSNSTIGAGTKAKHLSYIGDANIAEKVNIGAGTITCNYDGFQKHVTTIEKNVKIGSNNSLVAPVTIGHDAITGAGSVITSDVPPYALGIARALQVNKEQYAQRLNESRSFIGAIKTDTPSSHNEK
ncbi:MAG: bifunctional UDP-N-acetylglucosamine diphosphorylase/glucosamine-1-phosphate N-acetyltransferase GlmU [Candidatus Babeliaceae bacterium]|nr:bifunctional UDP-N-acetylglucosamine diphosphorylase/glucosamine-1-phosphate N-acetyltransferase GlmU [Candidatus Babeliaceae bacterium]